jgi:hypothetical protein
MANDKTDRVSTPAHWANHCAGCNKVLSDGEGKSEFVEGNGAVRRWDDGCYAARAEYLSMTLAPEWVRFGRKPPRSHHQHSPLEYMGGEDLYHPHHDPDYYRNGVDPIFQMTEAEFLGDVGDK